MSFDAYNRYQDRIEPSAHAYNNPYRHDRDSARAYAVLQAEKGAKDTIETSQNRLEKQLLAQFVLNHFQLPPGKFLFIAQVGRFLFLAIVMPPYIVFYSGPKWFFSVVLPPLSKMVDSGVEKLEKIFFAISAWTKDLWSALASRFNQVKVSRPKKKREGDNLFQQLAKDLRKQIEKMRQTYRSFANAANSISNFFVRKTSDLSHYVRTKFNNASTTIQKGWNFVATAITHTLNKFKERITSPFKAIAKTIERSATYIAKKTKEIVKAAVEPIVQAAHKVQQIATAIAIPMIAFYQNKIAPPIKSAVTAVMKPISAAIKIAESSLKWVQTKVQNTMQAIGAVIANRAQTVMNAALWPLRQVQGAVQARMRKVTEVAKAFVRPFRRAVNAIGNSLKENLKKRFVPYKKKWDQTVKVVSKVAVWFYSHVRKIPSRLKNLINRFIAWVIRISKKIFWGMRVLYTWAKIILIHRIETMPHF